MEKTSPLTPLEARSDSRHWEVALVERLPLSRIQAGSVYTARTVWKAKRCNPWDCWDG